MGPCDSVDDLPSSAGCSFIANRQLEALQEVDDGVVIANPNSSVDATIQFLQTPMGTNQEEMIEEIVLAPYESHVFRLTSDFVPGDSSAYRTGGTYRFQSNVPVIAYHHAPYTLSHGNDSSLLLPETSLRQDYIAMSYGPNVSLRAGEPSYFEIVALENFTTIEWWPPVATAGDGLPIPFVPSGGRGELKMNRFDTARIAASAMDTDIVPSRDISGTIIRSDKPIWITSGVACGRVPTRDLTLYPNGFCDPLQEVPIPLAYWGDTYVAAAAPVRDTERHWWRVFAGSDGVEITTDPPQDIGTIVLEERGDYIDFASPTGIHFTFHSDNGVFMPVEYLESKHYTGQEPDTEGYTTRGDPSMYQMVPTAQFLNRYVFATALGFPENYVQVIRAVGNADVTLYDADGGSMVISGYEPAGPDYEVAKQMIDGALPEGATGSYRIESDDPFGIVQVGYSSPTYDPNCIQEDPESMNSCPSSYAYPGGMKSDPIFIP